MDLPRSSAYYVSSPIKDRLDPQDKIEQIVLEYPRYGYRRVTAQLQRQGVNVNRKRVLRLMKASDLLCRPLKGFVVTTDSHHRLPIYPNLYQNQRPTRLDQIWVSDITYIRLENEFVYLAVILDVCSRKAIGWALSSSLEADLTVAALQSALRHRTPPSGCIHHSDRGVQYASHAYTDLLKQHGFRISMSRKGNPYDNATMESFFKTLKSEEVYLTDYRHVKEARQQIRHFIEQVYNQKRLHSALGYVPPVEYELQYKQRALTPT